MNFPHTAEIHAMTKSAGKYTYAKTGTTKCFLQPMSAELAQKYGITFSKAYKCYVPIDSGVKEKKRLIINGIQYGVSGTRIHNYGNLSHIEAVLEEV